MKQTKNLGLTDIVVCIFSLVIWYALVQSALGWGLEWQKSKFGNRLATVHMSNGEVKVGSYSFKDNEVVSLLQSSNGQVDLIKLKDIEKITFNKPHPHEVNQTLWRLWLPPVFVTGLFWLLVIMAYRKYGYSVEVLEPNTSS